MMHARSTSGRSFIGGVVLVLVLVLLALPVAGIAGTCETQAVFQNYQFTALDKACLEIIDAQASRLKVSNLGSSGCDGVSVDLGDIGGPETVKCEFIFEPISLDEPGSSVTATMRGPIQGSPPDTMVMELRAENDGANLIISADFSPIGAPTQTVEVYAQGVLVHSASGSSGPAVSIPPLRAFVKLGDIQGECTQNDKWAIGFDQPGDILVLRSGTTVSGDEVRIIAESQALSPDHISKCDVQAGGLLVPEFEVISVEVDGTPIDPCQIAASPDTNVLYVNGSQGGDDGPYDVQASAGGLVWAALLLPASGGNGKFVMHANYGDPTPLTVTALPASIGTMCFPVLLSSGGSPDAVWNNIGKESAVGASQYFDGSPISDPGTAPVIFLQLNSGDDTYLPVGTRVTFQGVIVDPAAASPKSVGTTNGVTLQML